MTARDPSRFRARLLALSLLAAAGALASPAIAQPRTADFIVAVVNSEPVTHSELRARVARVERQLAQQGVAVPAPEQLAREVLERLLSERAQLQLAREVGIKVDEATIDLAEQDVARQNQINVAELRRRLATDGISWTAFRADLRDQLLLARVRDREVAPTVRVSEFEIDQFLREQQAQADQADTQLNLAQVLVAVPENAPAAQVEALRVRAQDLQARARAGEDFAALVRQFSDAPGAAASGGAFGLRGIDRYPPLFIEAVASLPAGGISEVLRSGAGFHVLKVLERRQPDAMSVVQSRARHILLRPSPQQPEAAARQRLQEFKRRIDAGQADFAALAREHSQDASAAAGGDLGWAGPGLFVPEFEEVINALAPGQLAEPFASRFGVHLVQLMERRRVALDPREQREMARSALRQKKLEEAYERWAQDVRRRAYVELRQPPQ